MVRLSADALDECRRRIQREIPGRRGRKSDPLYTARRTLNASVGFFTAKQAGRLMPCSPMMPVSESKPPGASTSA